MPEQLYTFLSQMKWLVRIKKTIDEGILLLRRYEQKRVAYVRQHFRPHPLSHSYRFAILMTKKHEYVDMAIRQINSLHVHNPYHVFDLFCDDACYSYAKKCQSDLQYPDRTKITRVPWDQKQPWQIQKVLLLTWAMHHDAILCDADMYWYADPLIRQWQVLFYTRAYAFHDAPAEQRLIKKVSTAIKLDTASHFVTGLVYVPYPLVSDEMERRMLSYTKKILNLTAPTDPLHRLAEEIGVNLAIQSVLHEEDSTVLKQYDRPGDRQIVQALYYGCANEIM